MTHFVARIFALSLFIAITLSSGCKHRTESASLQSENEPITLNANKRKSIAEKHATCPFMGSAVAEGALPVYQNADNPLARVEDVKDLGNRGGGDLGFVLTAFSEGNHTRMLNESCSTNREKILTNQRPGECFH